MPALLETLSTFSAEDITPARKQILQQLINYITDTQKTGATTRLHFICTHNSRRSHLAQIWAQTMAYHFGIRDLYCFSGGTEATALYPQVAETLSVQGFQVIPLTETTNPIYAIKYASDEAPIIAFSKKYDHAFNPKSHFAAIMTCDQADTGCPIVHGASARITLTYTDPKHYDHTPQQAAKYAERSLDIAREMWWIFKTIAQ